jgi:uncharacterized repeat protein (TIGR04138 family)
MGSKTTHQPLITLRQLAREVGDYPEEAYHFVRDGLEYAARNVHGPMTPPQFTVAQYLSDEGIDLAEAMDRLQSGALPPAIEAAVRQAGGFDELNRNVGGSDLCWALRDFALRQWGLLASLVLHQWNIRRTEDFGRMIFALVDAGFMQKEPHDSIADFRAVYDFDEAFDKSYHIGDYIT